MAVDLKKVCNHFRFDGIFKSIEPFGDGHINDTYKVTYINEDEVDQNYILQVINHDIFKCPNDLMKNIEGVTSYLIKHIKDLKIEAYEVLNLVKSNEDKTHFQMDEYYYRAYTFIENAVGYTYTNDTSLLYEAGKSFGEFQKYLKGYPVTNLIETIENFHHTPKRYLDFEKIYKQNKLVLNDSCISETSFILERKNIVGLITDGLVSGEIPLRVTHNDTKLNNVLIDVNTGKGRCVIDLDTVMPGSALYDYGDAIRSCASTVEEDEEDLNLLKLDLDRFEAFTKGFLEILKDELTPKEVELLPMAAILMTFECGLRFLQDYLEGDIYFKVHKAKHNLIRAKNQFKFVKVMEENIDKMQAIIDKYI